MDGKLSPSDAPFPVIATLFGLTFVTGLIDALSFLGLGHVFTANMTGNVVFVGFALGGDADVSVLRSLAALGAFASGGVVGGMVTSRRPRTPARHLLIAMYAEILLLSVAVTVALVTGNEVTSVSVYLLIVSTAVAMGLRNAVVRRLAIPDLTTTVLTLTVTGLAPDSRLAGGAGSRRAANTVDPRHVRWGIDRRDAVAKIRNLDHAHRHDTRRCRTCVVSVFKRAFVMNTGKWSGRAR